MARKQSAKSTTTAARKRSIARRFNDALAGRATKAKVTDQRTIRRLERYRAELRAGSKSGNAPLTPLDVAMRVDELLKHGDTIVALRKLIKFRAHDYDRDAMANLLREMHPVYNYAPAAYRFAGVDDVTLLAAGIIERLPAKRGPKKGSGAKKAGEKATKKGVVKRRRSA